MKITNSIYIAYVVHVVYLVCLLPPLIPLRTEAQPAVGFRFATDINTLHSNRPLPLIRGTFSNMVVGPFYKHYFERGSIELGLNFCYKELPGGSNLPLVMQNFQKGDSTALTALEFEFKVAPRILEFLLAPKFGIIGGYRFKQEGFTTPKGRGLENLPLYAAVPIGFGLDFPTSFGTTGVSFYYEIGLTNFLKTSQWDTGGKIRAFHFEIHVCFFTSSEDRH
ncbi:MAG: hypothetical protein RML72_08360 [Bacteroidia bacterium]|nr:hypothetical protein [Bacteroidia bacterium]MDW8158868.1 hypothetical protein [Bacteroidia bacterium]